MKLLGLGVTRSGQSHLLPNAAGVSLFWAANMLGAGEYLTAAHCGLSSRGEASLQVLDRSVGGEAPADKLLISSWVES